MLVSVPLPGFSGLRPPDSAGFLLSVSFSPVAGIQWVETSGLTPNFMAKSCFSPVAGIQWVETEALLLSPFLPIEVSVPLPGFSGLRLKNFSPV